MSIDLIARHVVGETSLQLHDRGWKGSLTLILPSFQIYDVPRPGDPWPYFDHDLPHLKCISIDWQELTDKTVRVRCEYSTAAEAEDPEYYEASLDFGMKSVDRTQGWVWRDSQRPVTQDIETEIAIATYTIRMDRTVSPFDVMMDAIGRLNDRKFHGRPAETMRFLGCREEQSRGFDRELLRVSSEYVFAVLPHSHQLVDRAPVIDVDSDGNEIIYQDKDEDKPGYTTDATKVGTPKYVSGVAGQPGLDMPLNIYDLDEESNPKPRYDLCDFATVLGLPIQPGDDEPGEDEI